MSRAWEAFFFLYIYRFRLGRRSRFSIGAQIPNHRSEVPSWAEVCEPGLPSLKYWTVMYSEPTYSDTVEVIGQGFPCVAQGVEDWPSRPLNIFGSSQCLSDLIHERVRYFVDNNLEDLVTLCLRLGSKPVLFKS